jgi:hypothetical protein
MVSLTHALTLRPAKLKCRVTELTRREPGVTKSRISGSKALRRWYSGIDRPRSPGRTPSPRAECRVRPSCGVSATSVKGWVSTGPRDVRFPVTARLVWRKRRWRCQEPGCARSSFTESVPQIPAGQRVTRRLRGAAGRAVAEGAATVAQAARDFGLSWPVVHAAFLDHATTVLPEEPGPVVALGIDETRRGKPRFARGADTGVFEHITDRWPTGFVDWLGIRARWGRSKAAPTALPGPGWPPEHNTGATVSRPSRSTCARPNGTTVREHLPPRLWWSTISTSHNYPTRSPARYGAG